MKKIFVIIEDEVSEEKKYLKKGNKVAMIVRAENIIELAQTLNPISFLDTPIIKK